MRSRLVAELAQAVGATYCSAPPPPGADWLGRPRRGAVALVRPADAAQAAAVLRACVAAGAAVVPVGGDTGLVGGTLPSPGDRPVVLLSTDRMLGVSVDDVAGTVLAGAGESLAAVQRAAAEAGWRYGVDLAARDSATMGGTVATNAGGLHVCAYGTTRAQLLGLEAVLADGSVVADLRGLVKDNTGLDLRDLICGSEGILAVVTRVLLRLHQPPRRLVAVAVPVPTLAGGVTLMRHLARAGDVHACEVVDAESWCAAAAELGLRAPVRPVRFALLVELSDPDEGLLATVLTDEAPDAVVASEASDRRALWALREGQTEWWSRRRDVGAVLHKYDVGLPLSRLDEGWQQVARYLDTAAQVCAFGVFGHLAEGSLHVQALAEPGASRIDAAVLEIVARAGGSISAEHGIGRDKAEYLSLRRTEPEIAAGRAIKRALDPAGMMNPGVIFPELPVPEPVERPDALEKP